MNQAIELRTRQVGPWPMNTYALVNLNTRQSILIDPGADPETLRAMIADTTPIAVVLTHSHADHLGALEPMLELLDVPLLCHAGPHVNNLELAADRELKHGDTIMLGDVPIEIIATPGHTADMLSLRVSNDPRIVVGDTIFEGGPGRTWSATDFQTTLDTLRTIILEWPDATLCYPGHGPAFRLGDQRAAIERFVQHDHGAFFGDAAWELPDDAQASG